MTIVSTINPTIPVTGSPLDSAPVRGNFLAAYNDINALWTAISTIGSGIGTVTSIDVSGGSTGLTFSGGPVTTSGVITLAGTLAINSGGTGQTTASGAINAIVPSQTSNSGKALFTDGTSVSWGAVSGSGTVTSVDASGGTTGLTFSGGPITASGTLTLAGTLAVTNGGTGGTTANGAVANILPSQSGKSGQVLSTDGTNTQWIASSGSGTVTSVDVSGGTTGLTTSGGPITGIGTITIAGTLGVSNGGTGATTPNGALTNLLPSQTGNSGDALITDGTNTSWTKISGTYPIFDGDNTGATDVGPAIQSWALANNGYVYLAAGTYYIGTSVDPGSLGGSLRLIGVSGNRDDVIITYDPATVPIDFNSGSSGTVDPIVGDNGMNIIATTFSISAITQANPGIITTSVTHTLTQGEYIQISGIVGMTQLNGNVYRVGIVTATTLQLLDVNGVYINTTSFTAYVSGGTITRYIAFEAQQLNGQDYLHRLAVTDASGYSPSDIIHVVSQDILPSGNNKRAGESATVVWVDYQSNFIFLQTRLHQPMVYFTNPRVHRYTQAQQFAVENVTFTAKGDYMDPQFGTRIEAITCWAVPYARVRNCKFIGLWGQGPILRGCPYAIYEDNECTQLPNNLAFDSTATVRTVTAATQANPVVITTSASHGFNNGDTVYMFNNIGGMTEIRNTIFVVASVTSTTFAIQTLNTENINGTAFSAFTTGGSVSKAITVEGLGYGCSIYGASHGAVARNSRFRQCRHAVTTDGAGDSSYTTTEWYKYGQPTDVTFENLDAYETWGIAFDTHEEGYNIVFKNCHSYFPSRGAGGGTYDGMGFQVRCATTTIKDCETRGGYNGIIYRAIAHPFTPLHNNINMSIFSTASIQSGGSSSVNLDSGIIMEDSSSLVYPMTLNIQNPYIYNTGTSITTGKKTTVNVFDGEFLNTNVNVDAAAGAIIKHYGTMLCSYLNQTRTSTNNRIALMRSDLTNGGATLLLDRVKIVRGPTTNNPVNVFTEQDSTATKKYDYTLIEDDNSGSLAALTILTTGQTTLIRSATNSRTIVNTNKTLTSSTYTLMHNDNNQTLVMSSAVTQTVTIPKYIINSFVCEFVQIGVGVTTLTPGSGATLSGPTSTINSGDVLRIYVTSNSNGQSAVFNSVYIASSTLPVARGGTGLTSISQGDTFYGSATNVISALPKSTTATQYLSNTGTSNNPAWAAVSLTNGVTGILPSANGGAGTINGIVKSNGAGLTSLAIAGTDYVSTSVATAFTAQQNFALTSLVDGASISWDLSANQVSQVTLGGNRTLANPTNQAAGGTYILTVIQDSSGSRTLAYGANYKWPGGVAPVLSAGSGAVDILTFVSNGTNMYGVAQFAFA